jgi:phosphate transport system substrate-binding protein
LLLAAGAAVALPLIGRPARAQAGVVVGAGSALPRAVYQKWIEMAGSAAGLKVTYEQTSGAAALERLKNRAIDFASVDYPRRPALLREYQLIQFPTVLTPVVPFVNLPGVADGQLRLTGELLADIFLGKVTKWNDARIKAENGGVNLPATNIVPVHRVEPSGANMLFTTYLTRVSEAWAAGPRRDDRAMAAGQRRRGGRAGRAGGQGEVGAGRDRLRGRDHGQVQRLHVRFPEEPRR